MRRILLVVKYREDSGGRCSYDGTPNCYGGLYNSARFIFEMLRELGVHAKLVQVCDNNDIDREVTKFRPDTVIIEGLWVVPEKFPVLQKLHPKVEWIVRIHSEVPFLAYEGIAMDWINRYLEEGVFVASNSKIAQKDLETVFDSDGILYLPNWYPKIIPNPKKRPDKVLDIGCFGAIRPLKNQLMQAFAAIDYAASKGKKLRLHVNERTEQNGERVLKNLQALLPATGNQLIVHPWMVRPEFLKLVSEMDVCMQVSFSETFDITAADAVAMKVPLVASPQVHWCAPQSKAIPTDRECIVDHLNTVTGWGWNFIINSNLRKLNNFSDESEEVWQKFAAH